MGSYEEAFFYERGTPVRYLLADRAAVESEQQFPAMGAAGRFRLNYISRKVILKSFCKSGSIPTQIRQLIFYINSSKEQVDGFVGELTSAKRLRNTVYKKNYSHRLHGRARFYRIHLSSPNR